MKAKYLVILLLLGVLGVIIWQMISYEDTRIPIERTIPTIEKEEPFVFMTEEELAKIYPQVDYMAMTSGDYFKVLRPEIKEGQQQYKWNTLYLKGVNLGVAMPGHFPVEFSLSFGDYLRWFIQIGKMNANVIRTYTILPPEFYNAFAYYNLYYQNRPLYLLQGIWAEEPDNHNYFDVSFMERYQKEIRKTIDVMNGNAELKEQSGQAHGIYTADVTSYIVGYLLGREWEPNAVFLTNQKNKIHHFNGNFITIHEATPMEVWLAQMLDYTVQYETQRYLRQHPVSFINWLTLDPMYHNYEFIESKKVKEYDNDLVSVDFRKFNTTSLFTPGIFASYHVYPYYPDYIFLEKKYKEKTNYQGKKDNFLAYIEDLKAHTGAMPLLIAEYGLPSSRGVSHYTPAGFNQGGFSEHQQASLSAVLTRDIYNARCAGGIFFEWIDEWFKNNWLVMDFEQPNERRVFWHNMENPEQNFGILAVESRTKIIDGKTNDWKKMPKRGSTSFVKADADASYFYLTAYLPGVDLKKVNLYFTFDTYDKKKGDHKLPFLQKEVARGVEFIVRINAPRHAEILTDAPYSVYTDVLSGHIPVYASKENRAGLFVPQLLIANREKVTIFGDTIAKKIFNRSLLQFGNSADPRYSNANWYWNDHTKILELRLDWHLLNVSDPSSRSVLDDHPGTPAIEYVGTSGFYIEAYITDKNNKSVAADEKPEFKYFYKWNTWEVPKYSTRLKPIYDTLSMLFASMEVAQVAVAEEKPIKEQFKVCRYYNDRPGAISITFDDADYNQYLYALPVLNQYNIKADFGLVTQWLKEQPTFIAEEGSFAVKRMGIEQVRELIGQGHEIAFHGNEHKSYRQLPYKEIVKEFSEGKELLEKRLGIAIPLIHYPYSEIGESILKAAREVGFLFGRAGDASGSYSSVMDFMNLHTVVVYNSVTPNAGRLDSLLRQRYGEWTLFLYHHIFPSESKEYILYRAHNVVNTYTITPDDFTRHVRLIRNSGYWIAPVSEVGKYCKERENVIIKTKRSGNTILLQLLSSLNPQLYSHPLTVEYTTNHTRFMIRNSTSDGIYNARDHKLIFNVKPNQDVTIEIIE